MLALWGLVALYGVARALQVYPGRTPMLLVVALHVLPPIAFGWIHGTIAYRARGMLVFFGIFLVMGNVVENLGVATGFPFGRYYFTGLMGPKLFHVPVMLGLAYLGMGYISWTLGRIIVGGLDGPLRGAQVIVVPLVASSIIVAWDLAMDPVWATILHAWIWVDGGAYFGVPVSNFLGWYFNVYVMYQLFALYLRWWAIQGGPLPAGYWRVAVVFYAVCAAGNMFLAVPRRVGVVSDPTGVQWRVSGIVGACLLVSLFVMGAFAVTAWVRIGDRPRVR